MQNFASLVKSVLVSGFLISSAAFGATPSVTVGNGAGQIATAVPINVAFENTTGGDVVGFQFDIQFNATNLTADITNCGAGLPAITCANPSSGVIRVFGDGSLSAIASGSLGTIDFTIANNAALIGTTQTLTIAGALFSDAQTQPVTAGTLTNGSIAVQAAPAAAISVAPTTATFSAANGSTVSQTFTVTNSGNDAGLTVSSAAISGANAANFSVASNNCLTASPGLAIAGTCSIVVTFAPNAVSSFAASLDITSSAGNESIALTGIGTSGPVGALTITPATFDFGNVLTSSGTPTQSFTVTNSGAAGSSVDISSVTVAAPFSIASTGNTCATADLANGETCTVSVTFTPTVDGAASATLTVTGTDGNSDTKTGTSALSGTGITEARPTANPASGASESEVVGPEGSNDFTVIFGNTGNANYTVSCGTDDGDDPDVWSVTGGTTTTVAPGATHTVTTTCTLPDTETYTATLSCSVGQQTFTYNYECVGLPPLPVPVDNKWALALLALMILMAASSGFRFIARQ